MARSTRCSRHTAFVAAAFVGLWVLLGNSVTAAAARTVPLAQLPNVAEKLTAYGGYVVFSKYDTNTRVWRLMVWHRGSITPLPVPVRTTSFDANAGPAANGVPTVVYSLCAHEPVRLITGGNTGLPNPNAPKKEAPQLELNWARARACHIWELSLPSGSPRLVKAIHARGASDSTPAIWNGDIAFARVAAGSHVARIYLWHHIENRLVRLGAGPGPSCQPGAHGRKCVSDEGGPPGAWVTGMSLGSGALGYEWFDESSPPFGEGATPEIRIDPLRGGRQSAPSQVIETSFASGTSGFAFGGSPNAVGNGVLYARRAGGSSQIFSWFTSYEASARLWRLSRPTRGVIKAVAQDHGTTYWIRDVPLPEPVPGPPCRPSASACGTRVEESTSDCDPAHGACTLMQTNDLVLGPPGRLPYIPS